MAGQKERVNDERCPYWSKSTVVECGMTRGGMYIPMPEHVEMFCRTSSYHKCIQYIKGSERTMAQDENKMNMIPDGQDRRKMRRFEENLFLDLVVCDRSSGLQAMNAYKAKSLDVSLGGLRIESYKRFSTDTIVSFVLDPDFSSGSLLGVGEIKWCKPVKDSNKFESGISFSNYSTSESMREYLGM